MLKSVKKSPLTNKSKGFSASNIYETMLQKEANIIYGSRGGKKIGLSKSLASMAWPMDFQRRSDQVKALKTTYPFLLGCPRKLGSMVSKLIMIITYKIPINGMGYIQVITLNTPLRKGGISFWKPSFSGSMWNCGEGNHIFHWTMITGARLRANSESGWSIQPIWQLLLQPKENHLFMAWLVNLPLPNVPSSEMGRV